MQSCEPRVYLIAHTVLSPPSARAWLEDLGVRSDNTIFTRLSEPSSPYGPEKIVELAARRCYKSFEPGLNPNVTKIREDSESFMNNILRSGHGSVLEHANFTFAFEYVSRVFTHELVRHRAGCAYSQESLRYVRLTDLGFRMPGCIAEDPEARELFERTVANLEAAQAKLVEIFAEDLAGDFERKKTLTSAFRRIAPLGLATGIVATFNARTLRHILELRTAPAAEEEIRGVFLQVGDIVVQGFPLLFGDFDRVNRSGVWSWVPEYHKV